MKNSKENNHDWKSIIYLRIKRSVVARFKYLVAASIFVFVFAFVFALLFQSRYLSHTDVNSARYMLSALVQSQAAIVAIIITLTLIAVQLTASAYSPRVVDILIKNLDMRILLLLYGTSIFYGLTVLRLVEGNKGELVSQSVICSLGPLSISLEWCVSIAFWLGIITYVALFPYILNIANLLKPESIIKQLASAINGGKFLYSYLLCWGNVSGNDSRRLRRFLRDDLDLGWAENAEISKPDDKKIRIVKGENSAEIKITKEEKKATLTISGGGTYDLKVKDENGKLNLCFNLNEDPIQPIVDIIRGSIRKYDFETTRVGLSAVTDQVISVIDLNCEEEISNSISNSFCTRLQGVGKLAASITDEESTVEVIENLERFGKDTAGKGFGDAAQEVVKSLEAVGIAAARKRTELEDAVKDAALSLEGVGKAAAENKLDDAIVQTALSLEGVGKAAARNKLDDAIVQTALSLWYVEEKTVEVAEGNILKNVSEQVASSLGAVGKAAAEKGKDLETATIKVILHLENVGKVAAENKLDDAVMRTALLLEDVGKVAAENKLDDAVMRTALSLWGVEEKTVEVAEGNILKNVSEQVASSLGVVGEVAAENELKGAIEPIASSLAAVGRIAVKNKLEDAIKQVASSLAAVGTTAVKKGGLDDATRQVALFLDELSSLSEKIVKNTIRDYKRDLEGPDLDYFNQFIKLISEEMSQKYK